MDLEDLDQTNPLVKLLDRLIVMIRYDKIKTPDQVVKWLKNNSSKLSPEMRLKMKKTEFMTMYNLLYRGKKFSDDFDKKFTRILQSKPVRSRSGVSVLSVMTEAYFKIGEKEFNFSCAYDCDYCPDAEVDPSEIPEKYRHGLTINSKGKIHLPRSYPYGAPLTNRALYCNFDLEKQINARLQTYEMQGNEQSKLEVIVSGGTFHSYPKEYRLLFCNRLFYYCNIYGLSKTDCRDMLSLEEEKLINQTAKNNIIGLTVETRPDQINKATLKEARQCGITRFQIGFQTHIDALLERVNRGCYSHHMKRCFKLLKANGFKYGAHIMLDLPLPLKPDVLARIKMETYGKSREKRREIMSEIKPEDIDETISMEEFNRMTMKFFVGEDSSNDWFHPDDVKIYPTMATRDTQIYQWMLKGLYKPSADMIDPDVSPDDSKKKITHNPLFRVLKEYMPKIPRCIRVSRITREFQRDHVAGGIFCPNLTQILQNNGVRMQDIRSRELFPRTKPELKITKYRDCGGDEYFIEYCDKYSDAIYGFCRLRLCKTEDEWRVFDEIKGAALIRELHVYTQTTAPGESKYEIGSFQHRGLGTNLLQIAEEMSRNHRFEKICVIAGEGTIPYYCEPFRGYKPNDAFCSKFLIYKDLEIQNFILIYFYIVIIIQLLKYMIYIF